MKEKLMKNMGYLVSVLDIAIYFILSYIFVEGFENNILTILVNGSLLFIGAMVATSSMMKQGLLNGSDSKSFKDTLEAHIKQKQKIYPKLNSLQSWLDYDYSKLMKIGRSVFINSAGFDYEEIFDKNGKINNNFKLKKPEEKIIFKWYCRAFLPFFKLSRWLFSDDWHVYREKKRFIKKAKSYKITRLTVSDLMNVDVDKDPNYFGITERQYIIKESGMNFVSRFIFSCLLPCISWGFVGFNLSTFMVQLMSILLILMTAIFSMSCAYAFKVKTHRSSIIQKINKMEEFENADPSIFITPKKEVQTDVGICSALSVCAKSNMVEKIHGHDITGEENNICGNPNARV